MGFTPSGGDSEMAISITAEDNATDTINSVESGLGGMRKAAAGAGLALAGIGVGALAGAASAAMDFESAMAEVEKVTSGAVADELKGDIQDLSTEIPLAQNKLADLAAQAGRFGVEGADNIREFTKVAGQMGAATSLSAEEAGRSLAKMSTAVGEPLSEVGKLGDAVNELSNNFATDSAEIVDAAQRSGQAMSSLGLQSDQILGLAAAFNEVSPSSRVAARRMQMVSEAMMSPDNVGMFADMLGVTADEFKRMRDESPEDTMMQLMDAVEGNDDAMNSLNENLTKAQARAFRDTASSADQMREAMETSNTAMEEGGSLAKEVAVEADTFKGQLQLLKNQVMNVAINTGDVLLPVLKELLVPVTKAISAFSDLNQKTGGLAGAVAGISAVVGGLAVAFSALAPIISASVVPALSAAAATLSAVLAPVLALAAAVGALWYAWDNNLGGIQDAVRGFAETVRNAFTLTEGQTTSLRNSIQTISTQISASLSTIENAFRYVFANFITPLIEKVSALIGTHAGDIVSEFVGLANRVTAVLQAFGAWFNQFWNKWGDEIMAVVSTVWNFVEVVIVNALDAILTTVKVILALLQGDWKQAWNYIANFVQRAFGRIIEFLKGGAISGIKAGVSLLIGAIKAPFQALYGFLAGGEGGPGIIQRAINSIVSFVSGVGKEEIRQAFYLIGQAIRTVFLNLINAIVGAGGTIRTLITRISTYLREDAKGDIRQAFVSLLKAGETAFKNFIENIIGAGGLVRQMITRIATYLREDAVSNIRAAIGAVIDTIMAAFRGLYQGLIGGSLIPEMFTAIVNYIRTTAYEMFVGATTRLMNRVFEIIKTVLSNIFNQWKNILTRVFNFYRNIFTRVYETTRNALNSVRSFITNTISSIGSWLSSSGRSYIAGGFNAIRDAATSIASSLADSVVGTIEDMADSIVDAFVNGANEAIRRFNAIIPDSVSVPRVSVGGGGINIPSVRVGGRTFGGGSIRVPRKTFGGQTINLPQLAEGGIATGATLSMIGEGAQPEAVLPLDKLSRMLDTSYRQGASSGGSEVQVSLRVEGDDELTRLIRENAEVVVQNNEQSKQDRFKRLR